MKFTRLQTIIVCSIISGFILLGTGRNSLGVSSRQVNSDYIISCSSSITAIIGSIILLYFLFQFTPKYEGMPLSKRVPLWRRFVAFHIDFLLALLSLIPILSLPIIIAEYFYVGEFQWHFVREYARSTDDILAIGSALLGMFWVLMYYAYHSANSKQTIGQYLLGYRINTDISSLRTLPSTSWHILKGFIVLCAGWITIPLAFFHKNKQLFHEGENGFYPELMNYKCS